MDDLLDRLGADSELLGQLMSGGYGSEDLFSALMQRVSAKSGAPLMDLYHGSNKTTSVLQAAKEGEVSDEAVDFQIKKGPQGIKLLEQAAGEARCESMYFNILTIFQGFKRHNVAFSERFAHNLRYSSDIYSKDLSGLTQFLEEVVDVVS